MLTTVPSFAGWLQNLVQQLCNILRAEIAEIVTIRKLNELFCRPFFSVLAAETKVFAICAILRSAILVQQN